MTFVSALPALPTRAAAPGPTGGDIDRRDVQHDVDEDEAVQQLADERRPGGVLPEGREDERAT